MTGTSIPSRPMRWYEYALALLPFVIAFTGAIGLAIGPAACALNLVVMRSNAHPAVKFAAAVATAMLAVVVWALATRWMI
jgi:hypothetical protein